MKNNLIVQLSAYMPDIYVLKQIFKVDTYIDTLGARLPTMNSSCSLYCLFDLKDTL